MSSQEQEQSGRGERRSFTRFIRRASKVIRPKERSSGESSNVQSDKPTGPPSTSGPSTSAAMPAAAATTPGKIVAPKVARPAPPTGPEIIRTTPTSAAAHFRRQEEKARSLFAKYNMQLEVGEWTRPREASASNPEWIEKKVRIRVHRKCHRCQTPFGATSKSCATCEHTRCKKCPRFPEKSLAVDPETKKGLAGVRVDPDPKYKAITTKGKGVATLTMEGKRGSELHYRPQAQRVRRYCHKCEAMFQGKATNCETCKHPRCPKCPREPPKPNKYPNGYPGDQEELFPLVERMYRQHRQRVRWTCHQCQTVFKDHERDCRSCKHVRCDTCTREPPKKLPKPPPDESVVRALEEKMSRIALKGAA